MSIPRTNQHSAMRVNFLAEGYKNCFQLTLDKQLTNYNSDTLTTKPPKPFWSLKCLVDWISSWMLGYNPIICGPNLNVVIAVFFSEIQLIFMYLYMHR